jgi:Holliday junction resolvase
MTEKNKLPPLLQDEAEQRRRETHHRRPKKQERKVAKAVSGRRQPGSGAFEGHKGDVRRDDAGFPLLVECKRTEKLSFRLEVSHLTKITNEALTGGRHPALAIQFDEQIVRGVAGHRGEDPASTDWVAVPLSTFQAMLEALGEEGLSL